MIRRLAGSPLLRLFSVAVLDQAMLSAASLVVFLVLYRFTEAEQYGYYVLVLTSIALLVAAQGAWIGGPLSVLAPKESDDRRDHMLAAINHDQNRVLLRLLPLALVVPMIGGLIGVWSGQLALLGEVGVLAAWQMLRREFGRSALLIRGSPRTLFAADAIYVVCLLAGAGAAVLLPGSACIWAVLGMAGAAAAGDMYARRRLAFPAPIEAAAAREVWRQMRPLGVWAAVGATIYWVQSQSYNYTLALKLAVAAVAHVNAARLLLMPMFLLSTGVGSLLLPSVARWLHHEGLAFLIRRLWMFVAVVLAMDAMYFGLLWWARDWITGTIMNKEIPDRDLLILLWAGHALLGATHSVFMCALLAMERFRILAGLSALSAFAALAAMWFCVDRYGAPGAIMGTAVGELVYLTGVAILLTQSLRQDRAQRAALRSAQAPGTPERG